MKLKKVISVFLLSCFFMPNILMACGPDFDPAYFARASKEKFLSIPEGSFLYELSRIAGSPFAYRDAYTEDKTKENTSSADVKDLEEALSKISLNKNEKDNAVITYASIRSQIVSYQSTMAVEDSSIWYGGRFRSYERIKGKWRKLSIQEEVPKVIPAEFKIYTEGAILYHNGDFKKAAAVWQKLLELPKEERRYRSVWASFMIGKVLLSIHKQEKAISYFELTRKLASEEFKDSLNLSQESYGWQALAEYEKKDYRSSIHHYLKALDASSLNFLCIKLFGFKDNTLAELVKDDVCRQVFLGWVVSRYTQYSDGFLAGENEEPNQNEYAKLLEAIEKSNPKGAVQNADYIAWIYYNKGDMDKTKRWLDLSKEATPLSKFIATKVMLRNGKVEEAIKALKELLPLFEQSPEKEIFYNNNIIREVQSEIAVLVLSRKDYFLAFSTILKGKYWEDMAYVAEKVLTSDELEQYLKDHANDKEMKLFSSRWGFEWRTKEQVIEDNKKDEEEHKNLQLQYPDSFSGPFFPGSPRSLYEDLSYLLARRFAREGRWEKALEYMPTAENYSFREKDDAGNDTDVNKIINPKEELKKFISLYQKATDQSVPQQERAECYFKAGLLLRKYGLEIIGTELDPDGFLYGGQYFYGDAMQQRFAIAPEVLLKSNEEWDRDLVNELQGRRRKIEKNRDYFVGSVDEEGRALKSLPVPNKRFHYRYKAADLMWKCAELLPNNNELKAKALCLGGTFIKYSDPEAADKFYKALVKTCGETELGKEAEKLKWFPKIKT